MAIAYATVANGGTVVTPHVGMQIEDAAGRVLREIEPPPRRHVNVNPDLPGGDPRRHARGGAERRRHLLRRSSAASRSRSRARPGPRNGCRHAEQSWYIVLAPYPNPRIVTAVTIEEGGFGAESAAPAALEDPRGLLRQAHDRPRRPQRGEPGLMYATRARQARPEPFVARPGIVERLGLPYMDATLALSPRSR